jgi:hypothetical protein
MWMKPDTRREAMGDSSGGTSRGGRGWRAEKDRPRNLGDPTAWSRVDERDLLSLRIFPLTIGTT